jgi:3,4-dihydroxy 2-butanone 4-phosphate synthase/GTP cyclohydrolase II
MPANSVPEAIAALREGCFVIIVDDEDRENEGDLAIAAGAITPEAITFMAREASGLICVALHPDEVERFGLPPSVPPGRNGTRYGTAFTVSVEARDGVTTGISAYDRARTIQVLADPEAGPGDVVQPGHIFPLRCHPAGLFARAGQTEASVELALLAGWGGAAVICEVMDDDGRMARMPSLERFSARYDIPIVTIADLIEYLSEPSRRVEHARRFPGTAVAVQRQIEVQLPTTNGEFTLVSYVDRERPLGSEPHLALTIGNLNGPEPVLTRVHSECLTGDVFGSSRCDCGEQLDRALSEVAKRGRGVVVYLRQEGRGIGLENKLRAYQLQDTGLDTVEANRRLGFQPDERDYGVAAAILRDLGVARVTLLTNNPRKVDGLVEHGIDVAGRQPLVVTPQPANLDYLEAKRLKFGHYLPAVDRLEHRDVSL